MKILKQFSLFETLLVATIFGIHLYAALSDGYNFPNTWFIRDDAYYYFKVAQNITEGLGSTFDGINQTNGYHPLWMIICIPIFYLARFDLVLPLRILLMVIAALQAATAILIYRIALRSLSKAVAMLAACFWAFELYIHYALYRPGLESPLAAFAIVLFIERLGFFESTWRKQPVTNAQISGLAFIAAIVMFSRLDLIFLAVIAGIYIIFRGHPIRFLLPFDLAIIFLSVTSSSILRVGFPVYNFYSAATLNAVLIALTVKILVFYFSGLYQHPKIQTAQKLIWQVFIASTIGAAVFLGVMISAIQIGATQDFPRGALLFDWGISFGLILALRFLARWFGNKTINANLSILDPLSELHSRWKGWLTEGWIYYSILGGALALYMLYNKIIFGAYSPVSALIKRWWGTLLHTVYDRPAADWTAFFGISYQGVYDIWMPMSYTLSRIAVRVKPLYPGADTEDNRYYIVMTIFALIIFAVLLLNRKRALRAISNMALIPLAAGSAIHTLSYTATVYGGAKEWYWIGQTLLSIFMVAVVLDLVLKPLQKYKIGRLSLELTSAAAGIYLAYQLGFFIFTNMRHNYFPSDRPYMEVLTYLEENTKPNAVIGMTGGGNVAYFIKDRTIVNMDGLINSYDYFLALKNRQAPIYLREHGVRIVFANIRLLEFSPYEGQFTPYLSTFNASGNKNLMWLLPEPK